MLIETHQLVEEDNEEEQLLQELREDPDPVCEFSNLPQIQMAEQEYFEQKLESSFYKQPRPNAMQTRSALGV